MPGINELGTDGKGWEQLARIRFDYHRGEPGTAGEGRKLEKKMYWRTLFKAVRRKKNAVL